jgi:hypothetical protein
VVKKQPLSNTTHAPYQLSLCSKQAAADASSDRARNAQQRHAGR